MMNRSDWQAVRDILIADDRAKLGEPPTVDELLAYERGELSNEDAQRVQQLLVAYPELARAYATPFPSGDDADLPDEVIDRQWNAFRAADSGASGGRVLQFWRGLAAIAATVAIGFGAMLWQAHMEQLLPRVLSEPATMVPSGGRGLPAQHTRVTPSGDLALVVVSLVGPIDYESYRLELVNNDSQKIIWTSEPLRATSSGNFYIEIPCRILPDGAYELAAYGLRGDAREPVATYPIDVRRERAR
jgi:hypothetical protein